VSDLLEESDIGAQRADALFLLAQLEALDRAVALLEEALDEATSRPELQRSSTFGSRGRRASKWASSRPRASRKQRSTSLTELDDDALRCARSRCSRSSDASSVIPRRRRTRRERTTLATAVGDPELLKVAIGAQLNVLRVRIDIEGERALARAAYHQLAESGTSFGRRTRSSSSPGSSCGAAAWELAADYAARAHQIHHPVWARGAVGTPADGGRCRPSGSA
jgi:hypothetical protein